MAMVAPMQAPAQLDTAVPASTLPATPSVFDPCMPTRTALAASKKNLPTVTLRSLAMFTFCCCSACAAARSASPAPGLSWFISRTMSSGTTARRSTGADCRLMRLTSGATSVWPTKLPMPPMAAPRAAWAAALTTASVPGRPAGTAGACSPRLVGSPRALRRARSASATPELRPTPNAMPAPAAPTASVLCTTGSMQSA